MSCGTQAHGKLADCLRNGGCGIAFQWNNLQVADDPCGWTDLDGTKRRGRPVTARMVKGHPRCKNPACNYHASTDDLKIPQHVPGGGTQGKNGGGEYVGWEWE